MIMSTASTKSKRVLFTVIVLLFLSIALNVKHVLNKYIYVPDKSQQSLVKAKDTIYFKGNVYYAIKYPEFKMLPPIDTNSIVFLGNSLIQNFDVIEFFQNLNIKNRGIGGDITAGVLHRLNDIIKGKPKKVFIEIGINDLLHNISVDSVTNNIKSILDSIHIKSAKTTIYIQSLLPCNWNIYKTDSSVSPSIIKLNENIKLVCKDKFQYINLYDRLQLDNKLNPDYDCGDHLHLNGLGYVKWKELISKYVKN